jgi:DsbC/DsbD-like thiol-disulfide interchange protein
MNKPLLLAAAVVLAVAGMVRAAGSADKVKVNVTGGKPAADGTQTITIDLEVDPEWHIYANPVGVPDLATAATKVTIEGKAKLGDVKIDYPQGKVVQDKVVGNYSTYEGKVQIKATLKRASGDGPLKVSVKVQACNDKGMCLVPATIDKMID